MGLLGGAGMDPLSMGLLGAGTALMSGRRGLAQAPMAFAQGMMQGQDRIASQRAAALREQMAAQQMDVQRQQLGLQRDEFGLKREQYGAEREDKVRAATLKAAQEEALSQARDRFAQALQTSGGQWSAQLTQLGLNAGLKGEDLERLAKGRNFGREKLAFQNGVGVDAFDGTPRAVVPDVNQPFAPSIQGGQVVAAPNAPVQQFQLNRAAAGATRVNTPVNVLQEGEEAKTIGKFWGERYGEVQTAGMKAPGKIANIDRLAALLDGVQTGRLTPAITTLASYAQSLGLSVDEKLPAKQAAESLTAQMALQLRDPSGGAGMPGALSDADRAYLRGMVPGIEKTPEGNRLIMETSRKLAEREIQVARMAAEARRRGIPMEEFAMQLSEWSAANPLFRQDAAPGGVPSQPSASDPLGLRGPR